MIVDLDHGRRARVIMVRSSVTGTTDEDLIDLRLESDVDLVPVVQTVSLTAREARKIAAFLLWLAEKMEEERG
jgi:hypothetical protein